MDSDSGDRDSIGPDSIDADVLRRLTSLRQFVGNGERAPHKPLLVLLALAQFSSRGSSSLEWSVVEDRLGMLLGEFGRPPRTGGPRPNFPFTRLRSDGIWELSREVPMDAISPLRAAPIEGHFPAEIEEALRRSPATLLAAAKSVVEEQFPMTVAPDVLAAVGLDVDAVFAASPGRLGTSAARRRSASWRQQVIAAWDASCAFCGFDGSLGGFPVGLEAAHVRWFTMDGPDDLDNGLALCSLHHKLLDRGAIGLGDQQTIAVSTSYSASSDAGRWLYDLHGRKLHPRPGTPLPHPDHVHWHSREVFKGRALTA